VLALGGILRAASALAPTGDEIGKSESEVCQDRYSIAWNNFINDLFQDD